MLPRTLSLLYTHYKPFTLTERSAKRLKYIHLATSVTAPKYSVVKLLRTSLFLIGRAVTLVMGS